MHTLISPWCTRISAYTYIFHYLIFTIISLILLLLYWCKCNCIYSCCHWYVCANVISVMCWRHMLLAGVISFTCWRYISNVQTSYQLCADVISVKCWCHISYVLMPYQLWADVISVKCWCHISYVLTPYQLFIVDWSCPLSPVILLLDKEIRHFRQGDTSLSTRRYVTLDKEIRHFTQGDTSL